MISLPEGSTLFGLQPDKGKSPVWYERFLDARLARPQTSVNDEDLSAKNANYNLMLNHTAHSLKNMLIEQMAKLYIIRSGIVDQTLAEELKRTEPDYIGHQPDCTERADSIINLFEHLLFDFVFGIPD
ncbi:unnamed protein product [Rodentolepis nana]|uniref:PSD1 domain-containing protein n=1 Tax=Rodentolepis nana TaxID=102285 RepID=A0A0R3T510_RODNA|nr:unnamed protein product [Rodentolepis nana]